MRLKNRQEGGRLLAGLLSNYTQVKDMLVLAIPPGGVPVAAALARELGCPMDVLVVRTLKVPLHDPWAAEIVMGAAAPGGVRVLDFGVLTSSKVQPQELEQVTAFEQQELERLEGLYRFGRPNPELRGRSVILVADAIVIESTMRAAIECVRAMGAVWVVAVAPAGLDLTCEQVQRIADEFVCPLRSPYFCSVALWYDDPRNTTDEEIRSFLAPLFSISTPLVIDFPEQRRAGRGCVTLQPRLRL